MHRKRSGSMTTNTHQVEPRVPISHVDPLALLDDLFHLAATLLGRAPVAIPQQLGGPIGARRRGNGVKGKHREGLVEFAVGESLPDAVDGLLGREALLLLLGVFVLAIVLGGLRPGTLGVLGLLGRAIPMHAVLAG